VTLFLLPVVALCAIVLFVAYRTYGALLARLLKLDEGAVTPAVEMRDGADYEPIQPRFLLGQHFSAIAAAGPIVGPILAGLLFGWVPALIWIVVGSIFIGGVHDFTTLVASIRHRARSIAEVVRDHMTQRAYLLFLAFIWIALVYIIVAFTDITASSFVGRQTLDDGTVVSGGAIATSSLLYLALPLVMGLLLRYTRLSVGWATLAFLPLVGLAIWAGPQIPLDLGGLLGVGDAQAHRTWDVILLGYCFVASMVPVWLLLQPRGHLGGYILYAALAAAAVGLLLGGGTIQYPAFIGWTAASGQSLFPILFITIACGACSGFHAIIASGTTSKQLANEAHARPVGYGTMLLEAMVAIVALCCVMMLSPADPLLRQQPARPNLIYASGIASFVDALGVPRAFAMAFGLMAFTTFVYDTLDVCARLGRYIIQELTGWKGGWGQIAAAAITAAAPAYFVLQAATNAVGDPVPVWSVFWSLFGASNQLLAALSLLGVTVWLVRTGRRWAWWVTGLPTVWMYVMSVWALLIMTADGFTSATVPSAVPWVGVVLLGLAGLMLVEAVRVLSRPREHPPAGVALSPA
jgi:carbon starvation protein